MNANAESLRPMLAQAVLADAAEHAPDDVFVLGYRHAERRSIILHTFGDEMGRLAFAWLLVRLAFRTLVGKVTP